MFKFFKNLFKKKIKKDALQEAYDLGLITEEEKFKIECDRADNRLREFLSKKKGK